MKDHALHLTEARGRLDCPWCEDAGFPKTCIACGQGLLHALIVFRGESGRTYLTVSCDTCSHRYEGVAPAADASPEERPPRIVVVDDEPTITDLLEHTLSNGGFEVFSSNRAADALSMIREHEPALLILDLDMPEITGMEILEQMREQGLTESTAVVILTAFANETLRKQALSLGASDYIEKPFTGPVVRRQLERLMERLGLSKSDSPDR